MGMVMLAIPLLIDVLAVWQWRGGKRYAACIPLPFLAVAYAVDLYGVIQGGNLAGLFSMFAGPPAGLWLLAVAASDVGRGPTQQAPVGPVMAAVSALFVGLGILGVTGGLLIFFDQLQSAVYWCVGFFIAIMLAGLSYRHSSRRSPDGKGS